MYFDFSDAINKVKCMYADHLKNSQKKVDERIIITNDKIKGAWVLLTRQPPSTTQNFLNQMSEYVDEQFLNMNDLCKLNCNT